MKKTAAPIKPNVNTEATAQTFELSKDRSFYVNYSNDYSVESAKQKTSNIFIKDNDVSNHFAIFIHLPRPVARKIAKAIMQLTKGDKF